MDDTSDENFNPETGMPWWPRLPGFGANIGQLCQEWASLESAVAVLFAAVAGLPRHNTSLHIARCFELKNQIAGIRVAVTGFERHASLSDEILAAVDYIHNTIRPRRNRLVHDRWEEIRWSDTITAKRSNLSPRITRAQAFHPRRVEQTETVVEHLEDVLTTIREVGVYAAYLDALAMKVMEPDDPMNDHALNEARPSLPRPPLRRERPSPGGEDA